MLISKIFKKEKRNESIDFPGQKFKQTKPIRLHQKPVAPVKKSLEKFLLDTIYRPLLDSVNKDLGQKEKLNSKSAVINAIRKNQISYTGIAFVGKFTAPISKGLRDMGATYNSHLKSYKISSASIPSDVKSALAVSSIELEKTYKQFDANLFDINNRIDKEIENLTIDDDELFDDLAKQYDASTKSIGVQPELNPDTLNVLKDEYRDNLKLYIKNWTGEAIDRLRGKVQESVLGRGLRAEEEDLPGWVAG